MDTDDGVACIGCIDHYLQVIEKLMEQLLDERLKHET